MSETDRRGFLRGGLKAALAGTGGLLLPWQGGNVFALPTDLGAAAELPVRTMPLPVAKETLHLREIIERQRDWYRETPADRRHNIGNREWQALAAEYAAVADVILRRAITTWGQASEVAEIAWRYHDKTWRWDSEREWMALANAPYCGDRSGRFPSSASVLIEGVLALGGGQRNDPDDWNANRFRAAIY
jgi:hypothetical protein